MRAWIGSRWKCKLDGGPTASATTPPRPAPEAPGEAEDPGAPCSRRRMQAGRDHPRPGRPGWPPDASGHLKRALAPRSPASPPGPGPRPPRRRAAIGPGARAGLAPARPSAAASPGPQAGARESGRDRQHGTAAAPSQRPQPRRRPRTNSPRRGANRCHAGSLRAGTRRPGRRRQRAPPSPARQAAPLTGAPPSAVDAHSCATAGRGCRRKGARSSFSGRMGTYVKHRPRCTRQRANGGRRRALRPDWLLRAWRFSAGRGWRRDPPRIGPAPRSPGPAPGAIRAPPPCSPDPPSPPSARPGSISSRNLTHVSQIRLRGRGSGELGSLPTGGTRPRT